MESFFTLFATLAGSLILAVSPLWWIFRR